MDGRSLLPVIQSPGSTDRELLIEQPTLKAIRTPRYLYAEYKNGDSGALRPAERPLRAPEPPRRTAYASVKSTLRFRLHRLESCAGADCVMHKPDPAAP